jgi:hypothetical protein
LTIARLLLTAYLTPAIDSKYEIPARKVLSVLWLVAAIPFLVGLLLGALTRTRLVVLAVPALAIASVYWVGVGWNGDDYDIGRSGLILITGFLSVAFVSIWAFGLAFGRLVRIGLQSE